MEQGRIDKVFVGHRGTGRVVVIHGQEERDFYELSPHNELINHDPGFAWGYIGGGPHQLAFAILFDLHGRELALAAYHAFCDQVISNLPMHVSFKLTEEDINGWVDKYMAGVRWRS